MNWANLFRGTSWILGSQIASRASGMLTAVIVARWLGPEGLGQLSLVRDIGVVAVPLFTCGISQALTREIGRIRASDDNRAELSLLLSTVFCLTLLFAMVAPIVIVILSPVLADFYEIPELVATIRILALVVLVSVPYEMINAITAGFEEFKALGVRQLISALVSPLIIFLCVYIGGVAGAVLSSGVINLILLLLLFRHFIQEIYGPRQLSFILPGTAKAKQLIRGSLPLLGSIILMRPLNLIGSSTLVLYASLVELGWFRVAYTLYGLAMVIPSALQIPLLPMFAKIGDVDEIGSQGIFVARMIIVLSLPVFVAGVFLSGPVTTLLFGVAYTEAKGVVALMLVVGFFAMIVSVLETNIISQGKNMRQFIVNIANASVFVVMVQLLVPRIAHWGLAGGYLATECVASILYLYAFYKSHRNQATLIVRPFIYSSFFLVFSLLTNSLTHNMIFKSLLVVAAGLLSYLVLDPREKAGIRRYVKIR